MLSGDPALPVSGAHPGYDVSFAYDGFFARGGFFTYGGFRWSEPPVRSGSGQLCRPCPVGAVGVPRTRKPASHAAVVKDERAAGTTVRSAVRPESRVPAPAPWPDEPSAADARPAVSGSGAASGASVSNSGILRTDGDEPWASAPMRCLMVGGSDFSRGPACHRWVWDGISVDSSDRTAPPRSRTSSLTRSGIRLRVRSCCPVSGPAAGRPGSA
nr:hypothetical protein [Streptomyces tsukubensis NRRL18488]